jgi:Fuc2NAc and GlcNAc transferase
MIILGFTLICSFFLTYFVKNIAEKKLLMDIPNERSSHNKPTPRGGGLAIAVTWFFAITYFYFINRIDQNLYFGLMSGVLISGISFLDDIYNLKSSPRIIIHVISAILALYFIGDLKPIDIGLFTIENKWIIYFLYLSGIIWFTNLFNFIDGIDGHLASGTLLISLSLFLFIGDNLLLVLASSILGFLPWNWHRAKIFMGDIGSTLLGFSIAVLLVYYHNSGRFSIFLGLAITSIFWFDATYTLLKRLVNHEKIGQPHKKHAYQRIVQYGFSHEKTVLLASLINIVIFVSTYLLVNLKANSILVLCFSTVLMFTIYKWVDSKKPFNND